MASPRIINPQVFTPATRQADRVSRRPANPFNIIFRPYEFQPVMCHPVLPGETVSEVFFQGQAWSDPLAAALKNTGWHLEFFMFYVKQRDLPGWEEDADGLGRDLVQMWSENESLAANQDADGNAWTYCPPGGVDFLLEGTKRILEAYFRYQGEAWDAQLSSGSVPHVSVYGRGRRDVWDKLTLATAYADRRQALDFDASGTATVDDLDLAYREWAAKREGTLIDMDFEDWLKAAGGKAVVRDQEREDLHLPELVCDFREFTYPNNTVEPTTGVPAVAAGWRLSKQSRKAIRFPEWGWLMAYVVVRPKVYLKNQQGLVAAMMQSRDAWFPPNLDGREYQPHLLMDDATGPLKATMDAGNVDYYVDLRDLMQFGEQFVNYDPSTAPAGVAIPTATGARHYATGAEAMALFSDTVNGRFRMDGVINLGIKSHAVTKPQIDNLTLGKS